MGLFVKRLDPKIFGFVSLGLSVIFIVCCVVAYSTSWYKIGHNNEVFGIVSNETTQYFWTNYTDTTTTIEGGSSQTQKTSYRYSDDPEQTNTIKIFNTTLSFLTIALAVSLGVVGLQILKAFFGKKDFFGTLAILGALAAAALLAVSVFTFLGINSAFRQDSVCGGDSNTNDVNYCKNFTGNIQTDGPSNTINWQPDVAWIIAVVGIAVELGNAALMFFTG